MILLCGVREQKAFPFMHDIPAQPGSLPSLTNVLRSVPEHRKPRVPEGRAALSPGLHLFAAYVPALHIVLDQLAADNKGQELTMAKLLLGQLPLRGCVVTGDALLTQREICTTIIEGGGNYLFPVKDNQPALLHDIEEAFSPSAAAACGRTGGLGRPADASAASDRA